MRAEVDRARRSRRSRQSLLGGGVVAAICLLAIMAAAPARVPIQEPDVALAPLPGEETATGTAVRLASDGGWSGEMALGDEDRELLRTIFGIDDPDRLALSDSTPDAVLRYTALPPECVAADAAGIERPPGCRRVLVRVGLTAPREPGETWDTFVARVRDGGTAAWGRDARVHYNGLASLDPEARPAFEQLIADARRAGFRVRIAETYRSPERQAFLLARTDGRTRTPTSVHSYGRAVDVIIGDGRISRPTTARQWIAFRRWVLERPGAPFRLVGTPERTWDWGHVELATPLLGYRSVEELVQAARDCARGAADPLEAAERCRLAPNLPERLVRSRLAAGERHAGQAEAVTAE